MAHSANSNALPAQTASQPPYTQQAMSNLDLNLNQQPMTVASNMETRCSPTTIAGPPSLAPIFPPQNFDVPDISVTNSVTSSPMPSAPVPSDNLFARMGSMFPGINSQPFAGPAEPLSTISRSQMASQLGFQSAVLAQQASPASSISTTSPTRESTSEDSDDSLPLAQVSEVFCWIYFLY